MSANTLTGSLPRHIDTGIDDKSVPVPVASIEVFPVHTPLFFIKAARGSYDAILYTTYTDAVNQLGEETFDPELEFFNHQTLYALETLSAGNACMIKRVDVGATSARSTLIAVVEQTLTNPTWRDADGKPVSTPFVKKIYTGTETAPEDFGYTVSTIASGDIVKVVNRANASHGLMWKAKHDGNQFNAIVYTAYTGNTEEGVQLNNYKISLKVHPTEVTDTSFDFTEGVTAYPIMRLAAEAGTYGNNTGYRIWSAAPGNSNAVDSDVMDVASSFIYNIQLVKKLANGNVAVVQSMLEDTITQFAFKTGVTNYKTSEKLKVSNVVANYSDDGKATGTVPVTGPISEVTVYQNSISDLLTLLLAHEVTTRAELEEAMDSGFYVGPSVSATEYATLTFGDVPTDKYLLDIINGKDSTGADFYGFFMATTGNNVIAASRTKTVYLTGGTNGDLLDVTTGSNDPSDLTTYETNVIDLLNQVEDENFPLIEAARYPFTHIYDSGFSILTKKALMRWNDIRPAVFTTISVLMDGEDKLSASAELSRGLVLANEAKLFIESADWGTPACRIAIIMQSGMMANERYNKRVSLSIDLLVKRARYMGAGDGELKKEFAYDVYPNNIVDTLVDVSLTYLNTSNKLKAWTNGLTYVQAFDKNQMFYPAFHTIFETEESVLTGEIFVQICCNVKTQAEKVWRMFTGRSDLTNEQFIKNTTKAMQKLVSKSKYTNRVLVESQAIITPADANRGNVWQMRNTVYGNVAKTVQQATIVAKRMP